MINPYSDTSVHSLALFRADGIETHVDRNSVCIVDWSDYYGTYYIDFLKYQPGNNNGKFSSESIMIGFSGDGKVDSVDTIEQDVYYYLFKVKSGSTASASSSSTPVARSNHQHAYEWQILADPTNGYPLRVLFIEKMIISKFD